MTDFRELAFFIVTVGGVEFKMRHRCTHLMLQIGDVKKVLGILGGTEDGEARINAKEAEEAAQEYSRMSTKTVEVALVEIDGQPIEGLGLHAGELAHVEDVLFKAFLASGLSPDPSKQSLEGRKDC